MNFIVRVDHLTDGQLEFFGWIKVRPGDEFSIYWNPRYDERQPISNANPRFLVVDDWNDAQQMADDGDDESVIVGPSDPKGN